MARYVDAIDLPIPIEEAFDYLADFSRTAEWDPGVEEAVRLTAGKIEVGSRFRVIVSFLGNRIPLEYRIEELERPTRLVLSGGDSSMTSVDEITFVARPGGTRVTYEARVDLVGFRRLAEPIVDILFQRVGRLAVRGLRERFSTSEAPRNDEQHSNENNQNSRESVDNSESERDSVPRRAVERANGLNNNRKGRVAS